MFPSPTSLWSFCSRLLSDLPPDERDVAVVSPRDALVLIDLLKRASPPGAKQSRAYSEVAFRVMSAPPSSATAGEARTFAVAAPPEPGAEAPQLTPVSYSRAMQSLAAAAEEEQLSFVSPVPSLSSSPPLPQLPEQPQPPPPQQQQASSPQMSAWSDAVGAAVAAQEARAAREAADDDDAGGAAKPWASGAAAAPSHAPPPSPPPPPPPPPLPPLSPSFSKPDGRSLSPPHQLPAVHRHTSRLQAAARAAEAAAAAGRLRNGPASFVSASASAAAASAAAAAAAAGPPQPPADEHAAEDQEGVAPLGAAPPFGGAHVQQRHHSHAVGPRPGTGQLSGWATQAFPVGASLLGNAKAVSS